jgi:hypothetical protein
MQTRDTAGNPQYACRGGKSDGSKTKKEGRDREKRVAKNNWN